MRLSLRPLPRVVNVTFEHDSGHLHAAPTDVRFTFRAIKRGLDALLKTHRAGAGGDVGVGRFTREDHRRSPCKRHTRSTDVTSLMAFHEGQGVNPGCEAEVAEDIFHLHVVRISTSSKHAPSVTSIHVSRRLLQWRAHGARDLTRDEMPDALRSRSLHDHRWSIVGAVDSHSNDGARKPTRSVAPTRGHMVR